MEALFADLLPFWGDIPGWVQSITLGLLPAIVVVLAVVTPVGILGVWGERRGSGKIQDRIGPNRVGIPFLHDKYKWARIQGLGQGLADGIKLLGKEDFIPPGGNKLLFLMAPLIVFGGALGLFAVLPFSEGLQAIDPELGIFVVLAIGAVEVIGVLMAGWASDNKWSLLGSMREVAQVVSYEIPMSISALCPVLVAGTLQISAIVAYQQGNPSFWGIDVPMSGEWFLGWMIFHAFPFNIIACVIFYTCCLANLKRAPFDLPEAESELVAGFLTEYSGMRWSLFFLGEYGAMFALSGFTATLFLGGYGGPVHELFEMIGGTSGEFLARDPEVVSGIIGNLSWNPQGLVESLNAGGETLLLAAGDPNAAAAGLETPVFIRSLSGVIGGAIEFSWKTILLFWLMIQLRWTLPRLRIDQIMALCYKYLVPFAMVCLIFCALAGLAEGVAK